jgi:hypothetical protein
VQCLISRDPREVLVHVSRKLADFAATQFRIAAPVVGNLRTWQRAGRMTEWMMPRALYELNGPPAASPTREQRRVAVLNARIAWFRQRAHRGEGPQRRGPSRGPSRRSQRRWTRSSRSDERDLDLSDSDPRYGEILREIDVDPTEVPDGVVGVLRRWRTRSSTGAKRSRLRMFLRRR